LKTRKVGRRPWLAQREFTIDRKGRYITVRKMIYTSGMENMIINTADG